MRYETFQLFLFSLLAFKSWQGEGFQHRFTIIHWQTLVPLVTRSHHSLLDNRGKSHDQLAFPRSKYLTRDEANIVTLQELRYYATTDDVQNSEDVGARKEEEKISRRKLTRNALLVGAGVGTSMGRKPLKQAKAVAKATAKVTAKAAVAAASTVVKMPPVVSAANEGDTRVTRDSTVRQQASIMPGEMSTWRSTVSRDEVVALPTVGVRTKRVLLVRHGQTDFNKRKICQGRRLNPPLNDVGREQARQLLPNFSLDAIVCSPLRRARETAEIVQTSHLGTSVIMSNDLNEVDFGGAEGLPQAVAAVVLAPSYMAWKVGRFEVRSGRSGESGEDLQQRTAAAVEVLLHACTEGSQVLAVTHSSMIKFMLATLLGVPLSWIRKLGQDNCAVNALDFDPASGVWEAVVINGRRASGRADRFDSEA